MAFDKKYPNRKDWREPFRGAKAFDRSCRNHGTCPHCKNGRQFSNRKRELESIEVLNEIEG